MKKLKFIKLCMILILSIACENDKYLPVKEQPFLELNITEIAVGSLSETKTILVKSSSEWSIQKEDAKDWCIFEKKGSDSLLVTINENYMFQERKNTVKINNADKTVVLPISQDGVKKETTLRWHTLAVNSINGELKKEGDKYKILAKKLFISPQMRKKIFHGSILNKVFDINKGLTHMTNCTYAPITFGTTVNGKFFMNENVTPSFEVSNNLAKEVIKILPKQNGSFSYSSPLQFNSYKHLRMLGVGNLGLKLDEIVNGKPYTEKEMKNAIGLLYSYSFSTFSVIMDYPFDSLIKENISTNIAKDLVYVNTINYGRIAFLIIESPYDFKLTKNIVRKKISNESLNEAEKKVSESLKVTYVFFKENGDLGINQSADAIKLYFTQIIKQPIIPLNFTINGYNKGHSVENFKISFHLP